MNNKLFYLLLNVFLFEMIITLFIIFLKGIMINLNVVIK